MIYWFTGQPAAGKTTLAEHLKKFLESSGEKIVHVDGDDLRDVFENKDYSENGRRKNIERAQDIAKFMESKGYTVIVSLVSPYKEMREDFKKSTKNTFEIYVHTNDIRGRENFHVNNYEKPEENYIEIDTTNRTIVESSIELFNKLYL